MSTVAIEQALDLGPHECGQALLTIGEDQWFDRKSGRIAAKDLADLEIGFANAEGGTIVVGISNGIIEGIDRIGSHINAWRQAPIDFTLPVVPARARTIECINDQGNPDHLFVVEIDCSDKVHANKRDGVFLRVGDETRRLTFAQRQELLFDKGQSSFESTIVKEATWDDLDTELLDQYANALRHPDPKRLLIARGLMTPRNELTVGSILLFGNDPQALYPEAYIRVLKYQGIERGVGARLQLVEDFRCEGPIPIMLGEAQDKVAGWVPGRRALGPGGRFERVGLLPRDAWLEGVVNAVIHRSYSMMGDHVRIEIFDDRIEIESPGRFPGIADPHDPFSVTRFARNPRIARVCSDLNFGQELGEGIKRIFEEMKIAGLIEPVYQQSSGSVRLTLNSSLIDRHLENRLPRDARTIVRLIRENDRVSTGDLISATGLSRPVVIRKLRYLENEGVVEWVGLRPTDPRAYWRLKVE